jgi:hypothetical protein
LEGIFYIQEQGVYLWIICKYVRYHYAHELYKSLYEEWSIDFLLKYRPFHEGISLGWNNIFFVLPWLLYITVKKG